MPTKGSHQGVLLGGKQCSELLDYPINPASRTPVVVVLVVVQMYK